MELATRQPIRISTTLSEATHVAITAADILSTSGKTAVLEHLLSTLTSETVKGLSIEGRKTLLTALQRYEDFLEPITLQGRKRAFLEGYAVIVGKGEFPQVSLTIPKGGSRMNLISEANMLVEALYDRPGLTRDFLTGWHSPVDFTQIVDNPTTISFSDVPGQMLKKIDADVRDLTAGLLAYFIATGRDLFDGDDVLGRDGAIGWFEHGLSAVD
jgi:hypothetical protein